MHTRIAIAAATLATLAASLACTNRIAGIASPATTPPVAPAAEKSLDLDSYRTTPCSSLTDEQAAHHLGVEVTTQPDPQGLAGPGCRWEADSASITVSYPRADDGLTALYRHRAEHAVFEEIQLLGYPAASTATRPDTCTLTIGASDTTHLTVHYAPGDTDLGGLTVCQANSRIASEILATITTSSR